MKRYIFELNFDKLLKAVEQCKLQIIVIKTTSKTPKLQSISIFDLSQKCFLRTVYIFENLNFENIHRWSSNYAKSGCNDQSRAYLQHFNISLSFLLLLKPIFIFRKFELYNFQLIVLKLNMNFIDNVNLSQQSCTAYLNPAQPYSFQPYYSMLAFPNFMTEISEKFQFLETQFENIQKQVNLLKNQLKYLEKQRNGQQKEQSFILVKQKSGKMVKQFTKHIQCPIVDCRSKYSSKIAMRAHMRRCHIKKNIIL